MKLRSTILLAALMLGAMVVPAAPQTTLTVSTTDPILTETWTARIVFHIPPLTGRFAETCPLKAPPTSPFGSMFDESRTALALQGFPIDGVQFSHNVDRVRIQNTNYWRVTLTSSPIPATQPGRLEVGPLTVEAALFDGRFQRGFFGVQAHTAVSHFRTPRVIVTVHEPPLEGRPANYTGAIARNFTAVGKLDTNVCTAGDPLVFTLTLAGSTDPERIRMPSFAKQLKDAGIFRVDEASVKSTTQGDARIFTWRIRALKAGTVEFPALDFAYFDAGARAYRTVHTEPIPVQVKAGAQVVLGLSETDAAAEALPMPDGLNLDFPDGGTADFTFHRAVTLACRAQSPAEFAAAAQAYANYLEQQPRAPLKLSTVLLTYGAKERDLLARHCMNLGGLRLLGGDARGAWQAYVQAGLYQGEDAACRRGLLAACAHLRNNPRADLPVTRVLFAFWFRFTLLMRIVVTVGALILFLLLWYLAGCLGRNSVLAVVAALAVLPLSTQAQFARRFSFGGGGGATAKVTLELMPAETVVDEPSAFVFNFDVENGVDVEQLRFGGLPDPDAVGIVYGELERLPETKSPEKGCTRRRVRLPVRFTRPYTGTITSAVSGMLVTRRGNGTSFSFTSSVNFNARCAPCTVAVDSLPEHGRPANFMGAVGRDFRFRRRIAPVRVHPGDLVTAEYTLTFTGHFPTNVLPRVTGLKGFKAYDLKEVARTGSSVTWRQMLVPSTVTATNAPQAHVSYYDVAAKRYAESVTAAQRLVFISTEAATTENTAVLVDAPTAAASAKDARAQPLVLRFAPAETAPVITTLPPGTEMRVESIRGAWRRVITSAAAGWTK